MTTEEYEERDRSSPGVVRVPEHESNPPRARDRYLALADQWRERAQGLRGPNRLWARSKALAYKAAAEERGRVWEDTLRRFGGGDGAA